MPLRMPVTALLALLAIMMAPPAAAMTAQEYFADGNRLFRDDLYWAALLRYRQAAEQGTARRTGEPDAHPRRGPPPMPARTRATTS